MTNKPFVVCPDELSSVTEQSREWLHVHVVVRDWPVTGPGCGSVPWRLWSLASDSEVEVASLALAGRRVYAPCSVPCGPRRGDLSGDAVHRSVMQNKWSATASDHTSTYLNIMVQSLRKLLHVVCVSITVCHVPRKSFFYKNRSLMQETSASLL